MPVQQLYPRQRVNIISNHSIVFSKKHTHKTHTKNNKHCECEAGTKQSLSIDRVDQQNNIATTSTVLIHYYSISISVGDRRSLGESEDTKVIQQIVQVVQYLWNLTDLQDLKFQEFSKYSPRLSTQCLQPPQPILECVAVFQRRYAMQL